MTKPIPINEAGLRHEYHYLADTLAPAWGISRWIPLAPQGVAPNNRSPASAQVLLLASGVTGGLAVASALGLWPELDAARLGLDERGLFYLLVAGIYLLATTLYATWRTGFLNHVSEAPWDARLMAYANVTVGGVAIAVVGVAVLAVVAVIGVVIWLVALWLSGIGEPSED